MKRRCHDCGKVRQCSEWWTGLCGRSMWLWLCRKCTDKRIADDDDDEGFVIRLG